jgi:chromosome segregation ATPase
MQKGASVTAAEVSSMGAALSALEGRLSREVATSSERGRAAQALAQEAQAAVRSVEARLDGVEAEQRQGGSARGLEARCEGLESELESVSSIVLGIKTGFDAHREKVAAHGEQIEEFEQLCAVVEESVATSAADTEALKRDFAGFTEEVGASTERVASLVSRVLATAPENYDVVLAEANLSSVVEYNRAAGRRVLKLTKSVERLNDKVEAAQKGQESAWQAINEMMGRMQTIRDTVVRMTR